MPRLNRFDFYLFLPTVFLLGFGIGAVASVSSANLAYHLLYVFISLLLFFAFALLDIELIVPFAPFIYVFSLLLLILPLLIGTVSRGSVRWISFGNFTVQPSEIIKPFLALISAWFWAKEKFTYKKFFYFLLLFLPILFLVFLQPDLGSTLVILSILVGTVVLSRPTKKQVFTLLLISFLVAPVVFFILKDYQQMRLIHFLNPYSDPLGKGYNLIQAKIAVGSGGLFGLGLGRGSQSHLAFLPERHTDFIFASLAEELGLFGSILVLTLYLVLLLRILKIASFIEKNQASWLKFLLTMNLFFYLSFQIVVNIGMNIGLLPIAGITLPLISYGGSSLVTTMISLGILENLAQGSEDRSVLEIK